MQKSAQSKILNRRLALQMVRDLLVYTVVFAALALLANATVVPRLANDIADNTSRWLTFSYDDYPLAACLDALDGQVYYVTDAWDQVPADLALLTSGLGGVPVAESAEAEESGAVDVQESQSEQGEQANGASQATESATLEQLGIAPLDDRQIQAAGAAADPERTLFLLVTRHGVPEWTTLRSMQEMVIEQQLQSMGRDGRWQYSFEDGQVLQVRDLTTYYTVRPFKIPFAIILYLVGFLIIMFLGFGRALRYFDELAGAVGRIISRRDEPVKLSPPLLPTQEKLNEIRLASLADERAAKAAERRKDELVAYLAHDVKTPLTSVIGYLSLLDEAADMPPEVRRRYVATALRKAERLEELIDEFFEITRYNLQAIPVERAWVDVRLLCQQVAEEFYPEAQARTLEIAVDAPEGQTFFVDPDKFARALGNVVRNAVAYADAGTTVQITATLEAGGEGEGAPGARWRVAVSNRGREISSTHLQSIFDKFYREDAARSSGSGRAGLGLAIAREIVVAHDGEISAVSQGGVTTFTVTVPQA